MHDLFEHFPIMLHTWAGTPVWVWAVFALSVLLLLAFDLGVLQRDDREISVSRSLGLSAFYIGMGTLFGAWVWWQLGARAGMDYYTGFMIEKSLSMDNVFVFALIFGFLGIPRHYQFRVLFWGVLAAIVLRGAFIAGGAALVSEFSWVLYLFGAFLMVSGVKMLVVGDTDPDLEKSGFVRWIRTHIRLVPQLHGRHFFVRLADAPDVRPSWHSTPLFLSLLLVAGADIVFAVDSVPAIFAITQDPFIVYTSNIFAILGLRALYFALAAMIHRFHYLKYALALVLVFIGLKIFLVGLWKIPSGVSLGVTFGLILGGVLWSLYKTRVPKG